jgi:hypothetical protein
MVFQGIFAAITLLFLAPIFLGLSWVIGRVILHSLKVNKFDEGSKKGIGWDILAIIIGAIPALIIMVVGNSFGGSDSQVRGWPE